MKRIKLSTLLLGVFVILSACIKSETEEFIEVNSWIKENMQENYLWPERVPDEVDGRIPPGAYFGGILDPNDFISFITDRTVFFESEINERPFSSGLSPAFGRFSNSNNVFVLTEFVYPQSSADSNGIKRGDIVLAVDDIPLNISNFERLFFAERSIVRYTMGEFIPSQGIIAETGEVITVKQSQMDLNPVVHSSIIDTVNNKIGYLFYAEFLNGENGKFNDSLDMAVQNFKSEGVTDLIVDLRYNLGGDIDAAENLANAIVSSAAAQSEEVFVKFEYNENIEQEIINEEGQNSERLERKFTEVPENLGLQRVFFLTGGKTASTSELLINGLTPHMNVIKVGESTSGEFFGTTMLKGEDAVPPNDYIMVPVFVQYVNSEGAASLVFGIEPEIEVEDDLLAPFQIGDTEDPLLGAAVNFVINGSQKIRKYSPSKDYELLPVRTEEVKGSLLFKSEKKK